MANGAGGHRLTGRNRTGCGGCVTIFVLLIAAGLLLEAWQGSSTGTRVGMVLIEVVFLGGLYRLGRRAVAVKEGRASASTWWRAKK